MHKIFKCNKCGIYTIKENCPSCKSKTSTNKPPKFSLEDKWGKYRRKYKDELENKGN